MNTEQLNSARLARWSQNGEARLTLEAAAEWLESIGFCPWMPMAGARAPSLVEAVVGRPAAVPSAGERARARQLLVRLVDGGLAAPVVMRSAPTDEPEYLAAPSVLRYLLALRGRRSAKVPPETTGNDKVTPLALHCWQALVEHGALDAAALQRIVGGDTTETAILRALHELWAAFYVVPVYGAEGATRWELLARRFPQAAESAANMGQGVALSALISLYLHAAVASTEEEALAFLSPVSSQSKLREVLRGLGAMRQLDRVDVSGRAHVRLQGDLLPDSVEAVPEATVTSIAAEGDSEETPGKPRETRRFEPKRGAPPAERRDFQRAPGGGARREFGGRPTGGDRPPRRFDTGSTQRPAAGGRFAGRKFDPRQEDPRPRKPREETGQESPYRKKTEFSRPKDFQPRAKPFRPREEDQERGERRGFQKSRFGGPRNEREGGSRGARPERRGFDDRPKPFRRREDGKGGRPFPAKRPFRPKPEGEPGARPWKPREEGQERGERRPSSAKPRFSGSRGGAERRGSGERPERESFQPRAKPFRRREDGEGGKPFSPKRPFRDKPEGEPGAQKARKERGEKPFWTQRPPKRGKGGKPQAGGGKKRTGGKGGKKKT